MRTKSISPAWARMFRPKHGILLLAVPGLWAAGTWLDRGGFSARETERSRMLAPLPAPASRPPLGSQARARQADVFSRLPLAFVANQGQSDRQVRFTARGGGYELFLTSTEAVLALHRGVDSLARREARRGPELPAPALPPAVLRMRLAGADPDPHVRGMEPLPGKANYFIGNDPARWHTDIPTYRRVSYAGVYPGVDMVFYGNDGKLEYDLVVAPGANPRVIAIELAGADALRLTPRGDLEIEVGGTRLTMRRPTIYQEIGGARRPVRGAYKVNASRQVGFEIGEYDPRRPLVIDPVLLYAKTWGGSNLDEARGIAADAAGNAYVTGFTCSPNFPLANPLPNAPVPDPLCFAFVTKFDPAGTSLLYSTTIGGTGNDFGHAIAVDATGSAYVAGYAGSSSFPTTASAYQKTGGNDAFVLKLSAAGNSLVFSTFLGGPGVDVAYGIAVSGGNPYVTGDTDSNPFPKGAIELNSGQQPFQGTPGGGNDAFVARLNGNGSALVFSTYLGGSGAERGARIAVDATRVYVTGSTTSTNFPLLNPMQAASGGSSDAFVAKLTLIGTAIYSTYLGGSLNDDGEDIGVDGMGNAYVVGTTRSTNFPTMLAQQPQPGTLTNPRQAFVSKINPLGLALLYSTYLGGPSNAWGTGIAVDPAGNAYVAAWGNAGFPQSSPVQAFGGKNDVVVVQLDAVGSVRFASFVGGTGADRPYDIALDGAANAYITGVMAPSIPSLDEAFVAKLSIPPPPAAPLVCTQPPNTSMVAWYPFDEPPGGTTAANLASGNTGTRVGGPAVIPGKVGNALRFDGLDDYVESPSSFLTNFGPAALPQTCSGAWSSCRGDFSMDAWIRVQPSTASLTMPIVDKRGPSAGGQAAYGFWLRGGRLYLQMSWGISTSGTSHYTSPPIPAFDNRWHLVGVTVSRRGSPDGIRWYFDGTLIGTSNPTAPPTHYGSMVNSGPLRIGRASSTLSTAWFRGDLDEVEVFNRVLLPDEMQLIYNAGSAGKCKDPNALGSFESSLDQGVVVP